ncbi:MAG TPA: serine hydrolase domain-containing protein, partial [Cytophagaceae bacterium]
MNICGSNLELAKKLQEHMEEKRNGKGAGMSAAIIIDGKLVAACAIGTRGMDNSAADITDLYNVGSVSKVYCAAAIMKLVEMGLVDLDAPVCKYLPRFVMRDPRYKDITVRMTLCHSSGLPGSSYKKMMVNKWMGNDITEENYEYWRNSKLKADPGAFSVYCNEGFELAVAIIEEVTGKKYIDFLRDNITTPAGALSTAVGDMDTNGRVMMSAKGKKPEYIRAIGAGGIRTDIADCARFGWIFIEPNGIFTSESINEMCKPQGKTFLKEDNFTPLYGLGWDCVNFTSDSVYLGPGVLTKGGSTGQFSSELIVCPKYRVSAAISSTHDCETKNLELLCELIAIALKEERGIDVFTKKEKPVYVAKPVPADWSERFSGFYYSYMGILKVSVENDKLTVMLYDGAGWIPQKRFFPLPFEWNGEFFFNSDSTLRFERYNDCVYLKVYTPILGCEIPMAQKFERKVPVSDGWKKRIGKKYIGVNLSASDEDAAVLSGLTIRQFDDSGILLFANSVAGSSEFFTTFGVSCGDDETDMCLDTPGMGSRDLTTFFAYVKDGIEYI